MFISTRLLNWKVKTEVLIEDCIDSYNMFIDEELARLSKELKMRRPEESLYFQEILMHKAILKKLINDLYEGDAWIEVQKFPL